jgi:dihydrofolate reductase
LITGSGASAATSVEQALDFARGGDAALASQVGTAPGIDRSMVWIIGGGYVYREFLALATKAVITQIDAQYLVDTYAPDLDGLVDKGEWEVTDPGEWLVPQKASEIKRYRFVTYRRCIPPCAAKQG